jgi:CBS domain-containing protein
MSRDLIVANWTDSLEDAYVVMRTKGVRHLPVVDEHGLIVGIISDRDMQRAMQVEQPDLRSGYPARAEFDPIAIVRDFMSWPIESIDEGTALGAAARRMIHRKISALLVTSQEEVVGIITSEDLLRALVQAYESPVDRVRQSMEGVVANWPVGQIAQKAADAGL